MLVYTGVLITLLIPPLGIPIGLYGISNKEIGWKASILCIAMGIASFAYSYHPLGTPDLIRYFMRMTELAQKPFGEAVFSATESKNEYLYVYVFNAFCWLIGRSGDLNLAPGITVFIAYYIGLYVTCVYAEDNNVNSNRMALYVLFIVVAPQLVSITSNLRNITAFSIAGLALFRDTYQKKRNLVTLLLYVLPLFIHTSAALIVIVRLLIVMPNRFRVFGFGFVFFIHPIVNTAQLYSNRINSNTVIVNVFKSMIDSAYRYFNDTSSSWGLAVQNSLKQKISRYSYIGLALYIALLFLLKSILYRTESSIPGTVSDESAEEKKCRQHYIKTESRKQSKEYVMGVRDNKQKYVVNFGYIFALLTIACTTMLTPEYWRFATIMILFGAPMFFKICEIDDSGWWYYLNRGMLAFVPFFLLVAARNVLSAELSAFFLQPFISSPFYTLGRAAITLILGQL